jgi:hypothetical protein
MHKHSLFVFLFLIITFSAKTQSTTDSSEVSKVWSVEKANAWYNSHPWPVGSDFIPSTAINQLEMWQEATFDTATIKRE